MPYKEPKIEKLYYSMGEIAELFGLNGSSNSYWETIFARLGAYLLSAQRSRFNN
jgi:hypothetical protein